MLALGVSGYLCCFMVKKATTKAPSRRRGPGRPAASEAEARIEHILNAAADLFLKEGFDRVSVAAIAKLSGASKETLYARFPTKKELFEAVIARKTEILLQKFSRVLTTGKQVRTTLERYGLNLLDFMLLPETQRLNRTVLASAPQFPELASHYWHACPGREKQQLAEYLETQRKSGALSMPSAAKAAELFFSLCLGEFLSTAYLLVDQVPTPAEKKRHISTAVQVFLAAFGAKRKD
jgi:TetR/AcrR family transcriptional repressor of mexJK operon